ncbi:hypothetical protein JRO89_XS03G0100800 [Xanthoceras sorbifolium]|uniref:Uncharacterized protein n=1 Tax=Xanthoceras sorbifolium TaxID=99658 RepID=A0ABQ8I9D6_9ROSI|nr:hypothetical protein JRO89_XS03G0100800 [Xanthoceras sorbifolium]
MSLGPHTVIQLFGAVISRARTSNCSCEEEELQQLSRAGEENPPAGHATMGRVHVRKETAPVCCARTISCSCEEEELQQLSRAGEENPPAGHATMGRVHVREETAPVCCARWECDLGSRLSLARTKVEESSRSCDLLHAAWGRASCSRAKKKCSSNAYKGRPQEAEIVSLPSPAYNAFAFCCFLHRKCFCEYRVVTCVRPHGIETLPKGIISRTSDLQMRSLSGPGNKKLQEQKTALAVKYSQKPTPNNMMSGDMPFDPVCPNHGSDANLASCLTIIHKEFLKLTYWELG